jgi:hypothetical protein
MLSRILPKHTSKTFRYFSTGGEITDFVGLRDRNFISHADYTEIFNAVLGADSVNDMTNFLRAADGAMDDRMLSYSWQRVRFNNFQLDSSFENDYIPLTTRYIRTFTNENAESFAEIITYAGQLGVTDGEFWRAVKEVLVMQRMYRYMPIESFGEAIKSFAIVGQADETVLQLLGDVVIKHKRHIGEETKSTAKQGFQIAEIGFNEFKRALDDDEINELVIA